MTNLMSCLLHCSNCCCMVVLFVGLYHVVDSYQDHLNVPRHRWISFGQW